MKRFTILVSALAVVSASASAEDRFARFLAANSLPDGVVCGYTTTATSSEYPGETRVERYSLDDGWHLVSVNGEPPSAKARADYAEATEERARDRRRPMDLDLAAMVRADTVRVAEEDEHKIVFAFTPDSPDGSRARDMMAKMAGSLTVAKPDLRPLEYLITVDEPISPMPTMKVEEFRQEMTFAVEPVTGSSLMASMRFAMRGKAFVFRKIDAEAHIVVSDYDCRHETPTE